MKLRALALVVAAILALAACGKNDSPALEEGPATTATSTSTSTSTTTTTTSS